MLILGPGILI